MEREREGQRVRERGMDREGEKEEVGNVSEKV